MWLACGSQVTDEIREAMGSHTITDYLNDKWTGYLPEKYNTGGDEQDRYEFWNKISDKYEDADSAVEGVQAVIKYVKEDL